MERGQKRFVSALGRMCFLEHRVSSVVETLQAAGLHPSDYLLNPDAGVKWFFSTRSINSVTAVGLMTSDLNRDVLWCWVKRHISSVSGCQRFSHSYILTSSGFFLLSSGGADVHQLDLHHGPNFWKHALRNTTIFSCSQFNSSPQRKKIFRYLFSV